MADSITHFISAERYLKDKDVSDEFRRGLYFGSQGPDIFFFGSAKNSFAFGDSIHDNVPKQLFEAEFDKLFSGNDMYRGYAYGVMLHYFLDRIMHQYIGYLCRTYPKAYAHGEYEKDIDMVLYAKEYNEPIKKFKYNNYFVSSNNLYASVFSYWTERVNNDIITQEYVKGSIDKLMKMTKQMIKPSFVFKTIVKIMEKKRNIEGMISCHLKIKSSDRFFNDQREVWSGLNAQYNYSVGDIINVAVRDFSAECDYILECKKLNKKYEFRHSETFSCGK